MSFQARARPPRKRLRKTLRKLPRNNRPSQGRILGSNGGGGRVMEWRKDIFNNLVQLKRGYDLPESQIIKGEFPVVASTTIKAFHNSYKVNPPCVVTGRSGSLGSVQYINSKCWPLNTTLYSKDNQGNFPKYIYYYLKTIHLENFNSGAGVPTLNQNHLHKLEIKIPALSIQKKIASILSAYDDLIENNNRRIALLEKMAEEIYREWFVRMRFPGHEKIKFHKGVPEGWKVNRLGSLGVVITGKTPPTNISKYYNGKYFFIKTPDMHDNVFIFQTDETLTEDGIRSHSSQTIPPNSISVSCIGTGGIVSITTSICQTNQQINSIVLNSGEDLEWAFFTIRNLKETIRLFGATGATMTNLSKGKLCSLKIFMPNKELRDEYHQQTYPIFNQIRFLMSSNIKAKKSRNLLLSRLITGKLSIEDLDIHFPPSMLDSEPVEDKEANA